MPLVLLCIFKPFLYQDTQSQISKWPFVIDNLVSLQVQVDKENLLEFSFNYCTLLIHFPLFTAICKVPHIPFYLAILHIWSLETKRKEKEKKYKYWLSHFAKLWQSWVTFSCWRMWRVIFEISWRGYFLVVTSILSSHYVLWCLRYKLVLSLLHSNNKQMNFIITWSTCL